MDRLIYKIALCLFFQLLQEAEGWSERHTESTEQIKLYQKSQKDMEEALAYKENEIEVSWCNNFFSACSILLYMTKLLHQML